MRDHNGETLMRKVLIAAAALAFSTTFAFADDIMATRYGNTTITTDPSGTQTKIYYAADGSFTGKQAGLDFKGTWKLDGSGKVCLTTNPTLPGYPNPICSPVAQHNVGDTWKSGNFNVTLVQGVQ
jgi:hypothetical protein